MYTTKTMLIEFKGYKNKSLILLSALLASSVLLSSKAYSQGTTTLTNPLVPGAYSQMPLVPAPLGRPPAPGNNGSTPLPPPVGMTGAPTGIPSIPAIPSNQLGSSFSGLNFPATNPLGLPPGVANLIYAPLVPSSPSVTGAALPSINGFGNPAQSTLLQPTGGYAGTGGYYSTIPKIRRLGTNKTTQYELRGRTAVLGGGGNSQDEVTQFGPLAGYGVVNGVPTGGGYNNGPAGSNNANRVSSMDLGGGMRTRLGGAVLSTGKTVQDLNGYNVLYGNATPTLGAHLSTDFGQGASTAFSSVGRTPSYTTDFGFPLRPQTSLNAHPNEPGRIGVTSGVLTNF